MPIVICSIRKTPARARPCGPAWDCFMCTVVDVYEDGTTTYDSLSKWNHEAALSMQRLFSRC